MLALVGALGAADKHTKTLKTQELLTQISVSHLGRSSDSKLSEAEKIRKDTSMMKLDLQEAQSIAANKKIDKYWRESRRDMF